MAKGNVGKHKLEHLRVFSRLTGRGETESVYSRLGIWIENHRLVEVDTALQELKAAYPDASISSMVCDAIVDYGRKVSRREWRNRKSKADKPEA